jgi:hypothetical protein
MEWLGELGRRLMCWLRRRQFDRDLEEEMRFHLDMKAGNNRETGMDAGEARYGPAAIRQRTGVAGDCAGGVVVAVGGRVGAGRPVRVAGFWANPGIHRRGGIDAGPRSPWRRESCLGWRRR